MKKVKISICILALCVCVIYAYMSYSDFCKNPEYAEFGILGKIACILPFIVFAIIDIYLIIRIKNK